MTEEKTPRIHLEYNSDLDWKLFNGESLELCSSSYKLYSDLFKSIYEPMQKPRPKILIIGGGDRQLSKIVSSCQRDYFSLDIVDPLEGEYLKFSSVLNIDTYRSSCITAIPLTFNDWYEENSGIDDYDQIIIDCSESIVAETKEIYNPLVAYKLSNLLNEDNYEGEIYLYVPEEVNKDQNNEFILRMFRTFEIETQTSVDIPSWGESATFMKFSNKSKYHVHYTATFNTAASNRNTKEFFENNQHEQFSDIIKGIILKYNFDVRTKVSYPFPTGGHSGCFILGESHCNWHTFPESDFFQIDIYHCNYNPRMDYLFTDIRTAFSIPEKHLFLDKKLFNPILKISDRK